MKIVFHCGCLEPGRDGVGDYTRRLAGEVIRQGHHSSIIALNDPHVPSETNGKNPDSTGFKTVVQNSDGTDVPVLRLSRLQPWSQRLLFAKRFIDLQTPDWLSLQFVPYSFHPKGLPLRLPGQVKLLGGGRKWHMMFHELWIGPQTWFDLKSRILGNVQRHIIAQITQQARKCHTHLPQYLSQLKSLGANASALPLFSNIDPKTQNLRSSAAASGNSRAELKVAVFSHFSLPKELQHFFIQLAKDCDRQGSRLTLELCGKISPMQKTEWQEQISGSATITVHNWLTDENLSKVLNTCHAAATGFPVHCLPKSSGVMVCLAHQLPIIAPHQTQICDNPFLDKVLNACIVKEPTVKAIQRSAMTASLAPSHVAIDQIANDYLQDLAAHA